MRSQVSAMDICILGRVLTGRRVKRSLHTPCLLCRLQTVVFTILTTQSSLWLESLSASKSKFHQRWMRRWILSCIPILNITCKNPECPSFTWAKSKSPHPHSCLVATRDRKCRKVGQPPKLFMFLVITSLSFYVSSYLHILIKTIIINSFQNGLFTQNIILTRP